MARLSISEAARQAGISRQYLHTKYIKPGTITTFKDELDRPYIESADLIRVFNGRLPGPKTVVTPNDGSLHPPGLHKLTSENDSNATGLQVEVKVLREQLQAAQERERWYQSQMESMTGALKLLEHKTADQPKRGFWGRLFGGGA